MEGKSLRGEGRIGNLLPCSILFLLLFGVFLPALWNGFIQFDDPEYVIHNAYVRGGLTWEGIRWAFTTTSFPGYWHPLTWISHMVDCQIFGLNPWGHHLTSAVIHAFNGTLLFYVWRKMTGDFLGGFLIAALFGLHPLRVESVAWVAGRKDLLCAFFYILAMGVYIKWIRTPKTSRGKRGGLYLFLSGCYLMSMMCKPMGVTLPLILLGLDDWPLRRFMDHSNWVSFWRRITEKIPLFVLGIGIGIFTLFSMGKVGVPKMMADRSMVDHVENILISYQLYFQKIMFPIQLGVYYPHPGHWSLFQAGIAVCVVFGVTLLGWRIRKRIPYLWMGWLWFLVTLVPVIGLGGGGSQIIADRYSYIPSMGILMAIGLGTIELLRLLSWFSNYFFAVLAGMLLFYFLLTFQQIRYWRDSATLFRHTLEVTRDNWLIHYNLGALYVDIPGKSQEAMAEFRESIRIQPRFAAAHNDLGNLLAQTPGGWMEAIQEYRTAIRLEPNFSLAHNNLGGVLSRIPDSRDEAISEYKAAIRSNPNFAGAYYNLALILQENSHQLAAAADYFREAIRIQPDFVEAHDALGTVLKRMPGRLNEAMDEYRLALRIRPRFAAAHYNLALLLLESSGRKSEALIQLKMALEVNPQFELARRKIEELKEEPQ